ncbi:hypothetical protein RR48_08901 [Papilio machaon]|uniref:Uncharacterized protein n=1 Tax=Papilio machaon TaxID=76193 RepID=A0A194QWW5_PAPMA|nr:uncharacterized protein LOC123722482 [Papilio machaon]KPJ09450.1 hypothetical protein RR48_08901 [Papilio machaon]
MRAIILLSLFILSISFVKTAPQSKLQINPDVEGKPFVEEVLVESVLHVRSPSVARSSRTNTNTNLQDGTRVTENKI